MSKAAQQMDPPADLEARVADLERVVRILMGKLPEQHTGDDPLWLEVDGPQPASVTPAHARKSGSVDAHAVQTATSDAVRHGIEAENANAQKLATGLPSEGAAPGVMSAGGALPQQPEGATSKPEAEPAAKEEQQAIAERDQRLAQGEGKISHPQPGEPIEHTKPEDVEEDTEEGDKKKRSRGGSGSR